MESMYSPTGAAADHRLPLRPSEIETFARGLAARWGGVEAPSQATYDKWIGAIADDLNAHRGKSLVIAGDEQPLVVHALAWSINQALGNIGSTISFTDPITIGDTTRAHSLGSLVQDLNSGQVKLLIILGCNPAYDAPSNLHFAEALAKTTSVHWGLYEDETASRCTWHVPAAHYLESWSDARAYDGTASIVQPLIAPLYEGKTVHEVLSALIDPSPQRSYELVRETWRAVFGNDFENAWHKTLADGVVPNSAPPPKAVSYREDAVQSLLVKQNAAPPATQGSSAEQQSNIFELVLLPDPNVGDGHFANNGWLQELPKPMTKLTWENAVMLSPADAERLAINDGDLLQLTAHDASVIGPACIVPGHAAGCVTCHLGYGRTQAGGTGTGLGFNAYVLKVASPDGRITVKLAKTGGYRALARTQSHFAIDGRDIVRSTSIAELQKPAAPEHGSTTEHEHPSFYPEYAYEGFAWGMAIDLSKCMGCNACVVACQAENNIPIVGREQVIKNREMHWLRLDLYYEGEPANPEAIHQPMLCQHCENAPCEVVCPVAATTHSQEGLNEMTYNRCIGTRYCSNNCPYKVRRFNFLQYQDDTTPVLKLLRNPNVTVRSRGVMEKCTYCVQRINSARIEAKKQQVDSGGEMHIADDSLQTACQQACPSRAIVFGDINDPQSRVAQLKKDARNYSVLGDLNTQPRTTYLTRVRNPNSALT
jgi:molybdopterin-containing oxidoreductase family iron-sulfur binding subunit